MTTTPTPRRDDQRRDDQRRGSRNNDQRRRQRSNQSTTVDIWRTGGDLGEVSRIAVLEDPGALVRSLGEPPPLGGKDIGPYFESAVQRAAGIAAALAISVDLLDTDR